MRIKKCIENKGVKQFLTRTTLGSVLASVIGIVLDRLVSVRKTGAKN